MIIPTIHLNGTSREALLEQITNAASALYAALAVLDNAAPNGRDYYPQGPNALKQAQAEHGARIGRVRSVIAELEQLAEGIDNA